MFKMELVKQTMYVLKQLKNMFVKQRGMHPSKARLNTSYSYCLRNIFQVLPLLSIPTITYDPDLYILSHNALCYLSRLVFPFNLGWLLSKTLSVQASSCLSPLAGPTFLWRNSKLLNMAARPCPIWHIWFSQPSSSTSSSLSASSL